MASRFKNRLSNGRFGKISTLNTGISKEKLHRSLNSWRGKARIADEPPPKSIDQFSLYSQAFMIKLSECQDAL